jgi:Spy/CpxP family protein refolding chaperone
MQNIPLTVGSILVLVAGFALAQPGPGVPAMPRMPMMDKPETIGMMANIPDLTPEQMDKCDAMRVAHMKTVMPIRTEIQVAEIELDALWRADKLDAKKIVAKVKEIGDLQQKIELAMVNRRIEMHNLLTPEQRKAMRKMGMGRGMRGMMRGQMDGCPMGGECGGPQGPMMDQARPQGSPDCEMQ